MDVKRHPGRPSLDSAAPSTGLHLKLPTPDYDRLDRIARDRRESIQSVIRREVKRILLDERGGSV
jgi:hypothetical protein